MRASSASRSAAVARPFRDQIADHFIGMGLALVGTRLITVDQHNLDAGLRRDVTDAGAHEARADNANLF